MMQLEMFITVVEEHSFVKAAARVFRTQPAVSQGIRRLEDEIGNSLFARTHRRDLKLTPAGEVLYEFASRIIGLRDEALRALKENAVPSSGGICVGVGPEVGTDMFPDLIGNFQRKYPTVRVEMVCDQAGILLTGLKEREIDIVILGTEPDYQGTDNSLFIAPLFGYGLNSETVWTVQRLTGRSHYTCEFERILFAAIRKNTESANTSTTKRIRKYGRLRRFTGRNCKTALPV